MAFSLHVLRCQSLKPYLDFVKFRGFLGKASLGAFGEDRILGTNQRLFPRLFTLMYYPLIFKTFCMLHPPLQWRGGVLCEVFKNSGSSSDKDRYRDILLGNICGKNLTKHVRGNLVPIAKIVCGKSWFGPGLNGGETAFAHLYIRLVFDYCKHYKQSVACVFADITTAFAFLLRRIIFDDYDCDESLIKKLVACGFSDEDARTIIDVVSDKEWIGSVIACDSKASFAMCLANKFYVRS